MLFTTLQFFVFFAVLYLIYWMIQGRARLWLILIASILFYATWSELFAVHFLAVVAFNFFIVRSMSASDNASRRRLLLIVALVANFANLFLFKYYYLFLQILFDLSGQPYFEAQAFNEWLYQQTGQESIILPLAISFYTFQVTAYVIDEYRRLIPRKTDALEFFVFILFFPQLVAGPIMRYGDFMPQLNKIRPDENKIQLGVFLILLGLIKKTLIADNIAPAINTVYFDPYSYDGLSNFAAAVGYSVRVYCDFSGYTDMARGIGFLMGFSLPRNFIAPYLSKNMRDMWGRWHVTLATWLRDYLYIPLGGSRTSYWRVQLNTIITFTLGGLWHGANYTFIVWGFFHGVLLVLERVGNDVRDHFFPQFKARELAAAAERAAAKQSVEQTLSNQKLADGAGTETDENKGSSDASQNRWSPAIIGRRLLYGFEMGTRFTITFLLFTVGAVFFNAPNMDAALGMFYQIFTGASDEYLLVLPEKDGLLALMIPVLLMNWMQYRKSWRLPHKYIRYAFLLLMGIATLLLLGRFPPGGQEYIYFQF